ncbi:MAG: HPF/RaiA family ribosome-associated protein [Kordiimonadaceae bacterium]|nr:HPF/RaiA family ribosome-associated protein [Kordiimonadaceae bacterium]
MKIELQALHLELTPALERHIECKINMAFSRLEPQITVILVRLSEEHIGDKTTGATCWLQVSIDTLGNVVVEDTQVEIYAAIDRAVQRARRSVKRVVAL